MSSFLKYSTMSVTFLSRCFSNLNQSYREPKKKKKCCLFLKFIVQGKGINRCEWRCCHCLMVCTGRILCLKCLGVSPSCQFLILPSRCNGKWIDVPAPLTVQAALTDLFGLSCTSFLRCYKFKYCHSLRVKICELGKKGPCFA